MVLLLEAFVRGGLAYLFAFIFMGTVIWTLTHIGVRSWANVKEVLQVLLPAEMALLGSAVGFYFGSRK